MSKTFSDKERSIIKQKLLDSCQLCWGKYGYKKTSINELCRMAGISTGAFYLFYPSKEMLFFETAQQIGVMLNKIIMDNLPENRTKYDFAKRIKLIINELRGLTWFLSVSGEMEQLLRKLPPEFLEQDFKQDLDRFSLWIEAYRLKPVKDIERIVTAFQLLIVSLLYEKSLTADTVSAVDMMVDLLCENLFE